MRILGFVLCFCLAATLAQADMGRRFAHSQITRVEWASYLAEIKSTPGVEALTTPSRPESITYFVAAEQSAYCFTTGGPAYPAVIVTRVVERDGKVRMQNFGYFAGDEDAFSAWFQSFAKLGPEIEARLKGKP
jgi:hypothetical protein